MAKKDDLKSGLLRKKPNVAKKPIIDPQAAEEVVSQIHTDTPQEQKEEKPAEKALTPQTQTQPTPEKPEETTIKTSVDFEEELYYEMKMRLIRKRMTMRQYLDMLVRKDLGMEQ